MRCCISAVPFLEEKIQFLITGDEAFKSICRVLGPLTKKPTLGVQHAVEAGYLFKEHASISAWLFTFLSYCEVTKPLSRIKTITRMRRIYKRRLVIAGFIISELWVQKIGSAQVRKGLHRQEPLSGIATTHL